MLAAFYISYVAFNFGLQIEKDTTSVNKSLFLLLCGAVIGLLLISAGFSYEIRVLRRKTNWLIDATNWNINKLKTDQNTKVETSNSIDKNDIPDARWPWGEHHTETLGHLEAAARKFWVLYDPGDFSTAPTNEMVSEWLQSERGISREKARSIASMLRPDGLPTGPRR